MIQEQSDPASLSRLNDVALPPEVSMWPSAPGWWVLAAALLAVVAVLGVVLVRRHRALRYRREALAELRALRAAGDPGRLPALLKRVALCAYPRPEVAALAGEAWSHFLDRTGGVGRFESGAGATLVVVSFGSGPRGSTEELFDAAEAWIEAQGPAR